MHLALVIAPEDKNYLARLKPILAGHRVTVIQKCPQTAAELTLGVECADGQTRKIDGVICAQEAFLQKIVQKTKKVLIDDYAGSFFWRNKIPFVITDPISQIVTTRSGEFLFKRYVSKILKPELWQSEIPFEYEEITTIEEFADALFFAERSIAIAIDIETAKDPLRIQICSYSLIYNYEEKLNLKNFTFKIDSLQRIEWMRKLNATATPKIFQNGIYDNSWFIYYNTPVTNWCLDTMDLFHSWYAELPKKLDFLATFCIRNSWFWKNDSKTGVWEDYVRYGCQDVWATSCAFLYLIENLPDWAWRNYLNKFPLNFPCLLSGLRGWKIDKVARDAIREEQIPEIEENRKFLQDIVGNKNFNPGSWQQMRAVLSIINSNPRLKIDASDKKMLEKVGSQNAFNQLICTAAQDYKTASKLVSSYLNAELLNDRFLYTLAPSGTDTSRFASHGSVFWTGNSIQTIPRGSIIKSMYIADAGYYLAEPDAEQADARGVAYLSGDENLIATVEDERDYHRVNAEKFFGILYEQITDAIRNISKNVNHGTNFNMGAGVLLVTMGVKNVIKAQKLLGLDPRWPLLKVTQYLLDVYHTSYPDIKGKYYPWIVNQIQATHKIVGPTGLTRFFFGRPWENKPDLNAAIAHTAQSLTGQIINQGFLRLYEFEKRTNGDFKLLAQIHDSIPFQYRIGRLDLACEATRLMEIPTKVTDCQGKTRMMTIPIALKAEGTRWSELKKIPNWRDQCATR